MNVLAEDMDVLWASQANLRDRLTAVDVIAGLALEGDLEAADGLADAIEALRLRWKTHLEAQAWFFRKLYRHRVPGMMALAEHYLARHGHKVREVDVHLSGSNLHRLSTEEVAHRVRSLVQRLRAELQFTHQVLAAVRLPELTLRRQRATKRTMQAIETTPWPSPAPQTNVSRSHSL